MPAATRRTLFHLLAATLASPLSTRTCISLLLSLPFLHGGQRHQNLLPTRLRLNKTEQLHAPRTAAGAASL